MSDLTGGGAATHEAVAASDPAQARMDDLRHHALPLGWVADSLSMRCRYGLDGCDDLSCPCTCHDQRDRGAVRTAFRRGLTDGR